ncbi:MAG TPA: endonuclease V [Candidatus Nanoarchaeia archaeon]|nr:endonuclease V [Candidatus Nanoarchaeia archaeon]
MRHIDLEKLKREQESLIDEVILEDDFNELKTIGACYQAFFEDKIACCIVVCDKESLKILDKSFAEQEVQIPYVSGYVFYRECPVVIEAYHKLNIKPDILLCPFNGTLHPRIGEASQLGLVLNQPTIGVAKILIAGMTKGNEIYINNELKGFKLETKTGANPVYVSPGYKVSLKTSLEIVKKFIKEPHKLPEPMHIAHKLLNKYKKNLKSEN